MRVFYGYYLEVPYFVRPQVADVDELVERPRSVSVRVFLTLGYHPASGPEVLVVDGLAPDLPGGLVNIVHGELAARVIGNVEEAAAFVELEMAWALAFAGHSLRKYKQTVETRLYYL